MSYVELGVLVAVLLGVTLLVPYLMTEIRKGKISRRGLPDGASEPRPGRVGNPAPGHRDGQSDPYDLRARR